MGSNDRDDDDDDDEILMAASAWASAQDEDEGSSSSTDDNRHEVIIESKKQKSTKKKVSGTDKGQSTLRDDNNTQCNRNTLPTPNISETTTATRTATTYSLHLKNIPYDASQSDIRFAFLEKRCNVTSVRLVYDRDQKTGEKHFRGVAFVDLADEESYQRGITEFHNKAFLGKGRRVSVRPTRTKSELSDIVRRTEEKVANLIARSKEKKKVDGGDAVVDGDKRDDSSAKGKKTKDTKNKNKRRRSDSTDNNTNSSSTGDTQGSTKDMEHKKHKKETSDATKLDSQHRDGHARTTDRPESKTKKQHDTKSNVKAPEDANEALVSPITKAKNRTMPKKGAASPKHGKRATPKSEGSPPVKLTKKQRAKKAAVLRMLKFKGKKNKK